jgi:hypothetical protein
MKSKPPVLLPNPSGHGQHRGDAERPAHNPHPGERRRAMLKQVMVAALIPLLSACTNYYRVTDTVMHKTYYATDIDHSDSGAVVFTDSNTGETVTLQNSEVLELDHDAYLVGKVKQGQQSKQDQVCSTNPQ